MLQLLVRFNACFGFHVHKSHSISTIFFSLGKSSGGSGDPRSALLLSIQKGAKLKKTTTVDKSVPTVAGRIADSNTSIARTNSAAPSRPPPPNNGSAQMNGKPKLGGIFEGMSAMPKLKPVGGRSKFYTYK